MAGRCNASQDAQDAWDAGDASLASGRNADGSDAGSVFADEQLDQILRTFPRNLQFPRRLLDNFHTTLGLV